MRASTVCAMLLPVLAVAGDDCADDAGAQCLKAQALMRTKEEQWAAVAVGEEEEEVEGAKTSQRAAGQRESQWRLWKSGCTEKGVTTYDRIIKDKKPPTMPPLDGSTLLFVIDMQNDFVSGSFNQPCEHKRAFLTANLAKVIDTVSRRGGDVIASRDYHSREDCSFKGRDAATKAKNGQGCVNVQHLRAADEDGRYHNSFPPHTVFDYKDGRAMPTNGALEQELIRSALHHAKLAAEERGDPEAVETVYKGFHPSIDSFSAFPHYYTASEAEDWTGGFAMRPSVPSACLGRNAAAEAACYPREGDLLNATTAEGMARTDEIVRDRMRVKKIDKIVVTGLVFDFCVKETAIYVRKWLDLNGLKSTRVMIPVELARPALEGLPGVLGPLGTEKHIQEEISHMESEGVEMVQLAEADRGGSGSAKPRRARWFSRFFW